jgi:predicted nucleic acid-binding protein
MIASDTSAWIEYFKGDDTPASRLLELSLRDGNAVMPEPVLFEILSGPGITAGIAEMVAKLPLLRLLPEFWERAAALRRDLLKKNLRARAMDCLISQICIDHKVPLNTSDSDFRHFVRFGLRMAG